LVGPGYAAGQGGKLYVKPWTLGTGAQQGMGIKTPVHSLNYGGAGVGIGISPPIPVSLSVALPGMPGAGIGTVVRNPAKLWRMGLEDFEGVYVSLTAGAGVFLEGCVSLIFVGASSALITAISVLTGKGVGDFAAFLGSAITLCEGVGAIWGTAAGTGIGAGITVCTGYIKGIGNA
jgi:hypothetical protein